MKIKFLSLAMLSLILLSLFACEDELTKQIKEVERLKLLRQEMLELLTAQEYNLSPKQRELADVEQKIDSLNTEYFKYFEYSALFVSDEASEREIRRAEESYRLHAKMYEQVLRHGSKEKTVKSAEYLLKVSEESLQRAKKILKYGSVASAQLKIIEREKKNAYDRHYVLSALVDSMQVDLESIQSAYDSLSVLHNQAVFKLSEIQ